MTKKDYIKLAEAFANTEPPMDVLQNIQWRLDIRAVADVLQSDNPRFNRAKFLQAAGVINPLSK